jgi:hypothetical protein
MAAEDNPELRSKLEELEHELEVRELIQILLLVPVQSSRTADANKFTGGRYHRKGVWTLPAHARWGALGNRRDID